jgi:glycosyltransferase involved in cell wall biosynthesis
MIKGEKIVFFGGSDWWYHNPRSGRHILQEFVNNGNEAIYINSIPLRMPTPNKIGNFRRYVKKFKSYTRFLKRVDERLYVLTPISLPFYGISQIASLNTRLLLGQIAVARRVMGWHNVSPVIICATPAAALILPWIPRKATIYHLSDKYDRYRDISNQKKIADMDAVVVRESDALICASKLIFDSYKDISTNCYYIPHGCNVDLFNMAAACCLKKPADINDLRSPIIGYFGTLTESNDQDILEFCASQHPDWNIVLIGEVVSDYSRLYSYKNIRFLGQKPLQDLPAYGQYFDVCLMNWKMNEWIHYCNPVKTKEYLAMGKPVVSVPIPEIVETLGDVISIATTPQEFVGKIEYELRYDSEEKRQKRMEKVRKETWKSKTEEISSIIEMLLK